jgi:HSP20 family molecular chaperone IbpA
MWTEACALVDEAERMHRRFFDLLATPSARPVWEPPVNVFTAGAETQVAVALPGAAAEDVTVRLLPSGISVEAEVAPPALGARLNVVRLEIPYGRMRRHVPLPPGRYELVERRLANGCLVLRLKEVRT